MVRILREEWRFGQVEEEAIELEYSQRIRDQFKSKHLDEGKAINRYFRMKWWDFLDFVK